MQYCTTLQPSLIHDHDSDWDLSTCLDILAGKFAVVDTKGLAILVENPWNGHEENAQES